MNDQSRPRRRRSGQTRAKETPKSPLKRFAAAHPNQCWQSDFTHWALADGADAEILNWLDDHARLLVACIVSTRVTGDDVVDTLAHTIARLAEEHLRQGVPKLSEATVHVGPQANTRKSESEWCCP